VVDHDRSDASSVPILDTTLDALVNRSRQRVLVGLLRTNPQDNHDPQLSGDAEIGFENLVSLMIRMHHTHRLEPSRFEIVDVLAFGR